MADPLTLAWVESEIDSRPQPQLLHEPAPASLRPRILSAAAVAERHRALPLDDLAKLYPPAARSRP